MSYNPYAPNPYASMSPNPYGMYPNPYAPMFPGFFDTSTAQGRHQAAAFGANTLDQDPSNDDPYSAWLASPGGQAFNTAAESAAAYSRKQADFTMAQQKRQLDAQVAQMRQQGQLAQAELVLKRGDQQISRDRLAQELKIHQDSFGLDQQKFGLDRAKTYADYASTPDRMFMLGDLNSALGRVGQGLGVQPYGYSSQPTPKTMAGFDALSSPLGVNGQAPMSTGVQGQASSGTSGPIPTIWTGQALAGPSGSSPNGGSSSSMLGSGQMGSSPDTAAGGAGSAGSAASGPASDPRSSAISSIMKASPASDELGLDGNDVAALSAIQNIIKLRRPGALQQLRPGQQQGFMAGATRLGYYAPDVKADLQRSGIGQQSPLSY